MTDSRPGAARRYVGLATTAVVSLGAAAAVGWAAAVPVHDNGKAPALPQQSTARTSQQIDAARSQLQQVRRHLVRMLAQEDDLPRAKIPNLPTLVTQLPSVQVPQSSGTQPTATQPTVSQPAPAAPPQTQTTTGASGAHP